jgi:zinc protease
VLVTAANSLACHSLGANFKPDTGSKRWEVVHPMVRRLRLDNGLTAVLEVQRAAPAVAFQVWVKVGSADERSDEVGLAHLHEHMLFKGTKLRGPGEIARTVEAHGGEINAWTSFDNTVYHVVMASRFASAGLEVLADAVRHSAFDATELAREIEVVAEEIKRSLDMPSRRSSKALFAEAFRVHPYGRPVIGFEADVRAHTRARVVDFFDLHYRPDQLVLSAVGDFDEAALEREISTLFGGDWGRTGRTVDSERPVEPPIEGSRVALSYDEIKEAYLHLAFPIPGVRSPDTAALDVLAMLLGQGDASRLSLEVKRKRPLAKDVNAWAWTPKEPGLFGVSLVAAPASALEALEASVRVLRAMIHAPAEDKEVATVIALIEAEAVYQRETVQGLARKLGYYEAVAGGLEQEARYYEAVAQVTPDSLREVARRHLRFDRAVVTGLLPRGAPLDEAGVRGILERAQREIPVPLPPRRRADLPRLDVLGSPRPRRPELVVERLGSGATVVVREERSVPLFAMRAVFPGGLRYERPEENGRLTLASRTLTRGTKRLDAEELSHLIDALAGSLGASAGLNSTSVRGEFLSKHFAAAAELFADVIRDPAFPETEVARERSQLLLDIASRDDRPSMAAMELFSKTLYRRHPYRLSALGEQSTVEALSAADLRAYHARFMRNDALTLVVVGDVDAGEVLAFARRRFGESGEPPQPSPDVPQEEAWTGPRTARRTLQKAQSHLVLGFLGARLSDPWRRALEVLQNILGGQSGRLFLELRDRRSMAYSVAALLKEGVDPGSFAIYMGTSPEKIDPAIEAVRQQLQRVRDERVPDVELDRAKEHLIGTHAVGLQRNSARAGLIALDTCYGLGPEASNRYPEEIAAVTAEEVRDAAQRVIDFEREALVVVGPEASGNGPSEAC